MSDELAEHLDALARDDCYRVDAVLKESPIETTQRVYFVGANGAEQGPYVRKYLDSDAGLGAAYERIWKAQRSGRRFLHLPRIVECYATGELRAVVMEYVQGETLAEVVYRCDPSVALASDVFPRLCDAVCELHEGFDPPIIHRDLKPSNVMLTRDNLTVIDFGIARSFNVDAEEDTRRFGTRAYAPPEQFGFVQTDERSDVYALGLLLYFCLTEKTPDAAARKTGFRSPMIPDQLQAIVERAAAFDPEDRFASVGDLKRAFLAALGRGESGFAPYSPPAATSFGTIVAQASHGGAAERRGGFAGFLASALARVPRWVGIVWDVVLASLLALLCIGLVGQTVDPRSGSAQYAVAPMWLRAVSYGSLFLVVAPVLFAVCDRRPLRRFVPALASVSVERSMAAAFVLMAVGFFVFMLTGQLFPPIE